MVVTAVAATTSIYATLRQQILSGDLASGVPFSQVKLAESMGVSRTPLREALKMLEREGLIETSPNRQARVAAIRVEDVDDLYGARILIESAALAVSMRSATPADVGLVFALLREMDAVAASHDTLAWEVPHARFHEALIAHAGVRTLQITCDLRDHSQMYRSRILSEPLAWTTAAREHQEIAEAFARPDVSATVGLLAQHYARTSLTLIARLDPKYNPQRIRAALTVAESGGWGR